MTTSQGYETPRETADYQGSGADTGGVKETVQGQAQNVAGTVQDEAGALVGTAKEQAAAVVSDVRTQGMQLVDEARGQLTDHAGTQRDSAVDALRSMSDDLSSMAEHAQGSGLAVQLTREGGELARKAADFLADRDPSQLLDEIRGLARRRPGAFLLGAAAAGLIMGRATRGMISAHQSDSQSSGSRQNATTDLGQSYVPPTTQHQTAADFSSQTSTSPTGPLVGGEWAGESLDQPGRQP